jgi:hypothetical protein
VSKMLEEGKRGSDSTRMAYMAIMQMGYRSSTYQYQELTSGNKPLAPIVTLLSGITTEVITLYLLLALESRESYGRHPDKNLPRAVWLLLLSYYIGTSNND